MIRPPRYFWNVFLSLVVFILFGSGLFGYLLYRHLSGTTLQSLQSDLRKETESMSQIARESPEILQNPEKIVNAVHTEDRITIIALDGVVLADNWAEIMHKEVLENHAGRPEVKAAMRGAPVFAQRFSNTVKKEMMYYAVPVPDPGNPSFILRLSFGMNTYYEELAEIRNYLVGLAGVSILSCLPLAYLLSRADARQINRLRAAAKKVAEGDLAYRIPEEGSLEFRELAEDFNGMADQLSRKIDSIRQEHTRIESLLSRMVEGVLAIDGHGKAVFANTAFCRMFSLAEDRVPGRSTLEIVRNDELSDFISELMKNPAASQSREIKVLSTDGERYFSVQSTRVADDAEAMLLLVFHDISGIKRLEQVRKDFVANVSHELRTPLTALVGSTEVLLDGLYRKPEESRKFLEIMDKQLRNIQNLVSDMLRLAAVEDARTPFQQEDVLLRDLVDNATATVESIAQKKRQTLKIEIPKEPVMLFVDVAQISAALTNLLDNAVKYTPEEGNIEMEAVLQDGIRFEVRDNGPGIPRALQSRIFERFYRVDKSRSREMGGTGLGLAITRHCVENHGGSVSLQSEAGKGTVFTIQLPPSCLAKAGAERN